MSFTAHPLWLVGFRPFFILACLAGLSLPALWLTLHFGFEDMVHRNGASPIHRIQVLLVKTRLICSNHVINCLYEPRVCCSINSTIGRATAGLVFIQRRRARSRSRAQ